MQAQGWMDSATYNKWAREVILPFFNGRPGYLLQDQFSIHMNEENLHLIQQAGIEVDFIPAGHTACLQVLDKGIHKPFKHFLKQESIDWLVNAESNAKPDRTTIANWISKAWGQVTIDTIINTWDSP